jgi:hypothetical protein
VTIVESYEKKFGMYKEYQQRDREAMLDMKDQIEVLTNQLLKAQDSQKIAIEKEKLLEERLKEVIEKQHKTHSPEKKEASPVK